MNLFTRRNRIWLVGSVFVGLFLGLLLSGAMLLILDADPAEFSTTEIQPGGIEVSITEDYINQIMKDNVPDVPGPVSLQTMHIDLQPDQRATFKAQLNVGPLEPVVEGSVGFRASAAGALTVKLLDAKIGPLSLRRLVPDVLMDRVNTILEEEIMDRVGSIGLRIVGMDSDTAHLYIYLDSS